jgi:hypothetical protein
VNVAGDKVYSPFNSAKILNAAGRRIVKKPDGLMAKMVGQKMAGGIADADGKVTAGGYLSRVTAGTRVGNMSGGQFGKAAGSLGDFMKGAGYSADAAQDILKAGQGATKQAISLSGGGAVSGRMSGFAMTARGEMMDDVVKKGILGQGKTGQASMRAINAGSSVAEKWAQQVGVQGQKATVSSVRAGIAKQVGKKGVGQVGKVAAGKLALKGGAMIGASLLGGPVGWAIGAALTAKFVYDMTKLAVTGIGHAAKGSVRLAADGFKSYTAGLNKGPFESNFQDNEVTMTSRSRGVAAISNSRLNARSLLGSEAASMYSHFG